MFKKFWERHEEKYGTKPEAVAASNESGADKEELTIDLFARLAEDPEIGKFVSMWLNHREAPGETSNVEMSNAEEQIGQAITAKGFAVNPGEIRVFLEDFAASEQEAA